MPADSRPPSLTLTLTGVDPAIESPQATGSTVTVRLRVADETGISLSQTTTVSGPTLQLDGGAPIRIAEYFTGASDGRSGEFLFPLRDLTPGNYVLRVQVRDLSNNLTEGTLAFRVSDQPALSIFRLVGLPNPVREQSQWQLTHNRPGQPLRWTGRLVDLTGRTLTEWHDECYDCAETIRVGEYNRLTTPLPAGMYVLRVQLTNPETGEQATASSRLLFAN